MWSHDYLEMLRQVIPSTHKDRTEQMGEYGRALMQNIDCYMFPKHIKHYHEQVTDLQFKIQLTQNTYLVAIPV